MAFVEAISMRFEKAGRLSDSGKAISLTFHAELQKGRHILGHSLLKVNLVLTFGHRGFGLRLGRAVFDVCIQSRRRATREKNCNAEREKKIFHVNRGC